MVLLVDVGNSNIVFGFFENDKIKESFRLKTIKDRLCDEYIISFKLLIGEYKFEDVIISSVVPVITSTLVKMFKKYYDISAKVLGPGLKTGIMIKADNPKEVGADLICAVAGAMKYSSDSLIIDLGTATKYIYQHNNKFMGLSIAPGVAISMKALVTSAALLPSVELQTPKNVLCNNTISCMQSGLIYGTICQVDAMIDRISEEIGNVDLKIIATGGLSSLIIPLCKHDIIIDDDLVLKGLFEIYKHNLK